MEIPRRSFSGLEENTLAILDASGVKDSRDVHDDRLSFLEAVRAASIIAPHGSVPTRKMFNAIFKIFRDGTSLELTMASYQLLRDLDKLFPRVYLGQSDEIVMVPEAWSPFIFGSENASEDESSGTSIGLINSDIAEALSGKDSRTFGVKDFGDMIFLQYLVDILEEDFVTRSTAYTKKRNWALLRESLLNLLLGSRRINFKGLIKECLSIICDRCYDLEEFENSLSKKAHDCNVAVTIAMPEVQKDICVSMQRFFTLVMELDIIKREADSEGITSRADGLRTPLLEILLEELSYSKDLLPLFLKVFSEPRWKLKIILQFLNKYSSAPSVRTRRSTNSLEATTLDNYLKFFSDETKARNMARKIGAEVAQILLAHAFQAYVTLRYGLETAITSDEDIGSSPDKEMCKNAVSAFRNLRRTHRSADIDHFGKEALFMAATILSREK